MAAISEEMVLLLALIALTILLSMGVLLARDNFFSAMYMSATLIMVASIYAFFGIQPLFILIIFIFVGVTGIVTVALAATFRSEPEKASPGFWGPLALTTALIVAISLSTSLRHHPESGMGAIQFELGGFLGNPGYILLIISLTSLGILLMLSVLKMIGGVNECR
ncbi:MAG TPA: hypothetical protein ENG09_05105 [Candidatus Syntrophoarchaeum butanivorans]|uniref:NADH-quinone oxidoreductase subunit J n=1 Tax=Candidatus Syntropharchaeum butanivorans TaxID=1839936 RepID=A0A7C1B678_9EURY|nr:hypothetical protein [Candidatus Syntrophoarchaeum butanivorans]